METVITAMIVIGMLLLSIMSVTNSSISAQAAISEASRAMQEREGERMRTALTVLSATTAQGRNAVTITLKNTGSTQLYNYEKWDVILHYADGSTYGRMRWYAYGIGNDQWNYGTSKDFFNPGILDPGEEIVITVNLSVKVSSNTANNLAIVVTPNGITAWTGFSS